MSAPRSYGVTLERSDTLVVPRHPDAPVRQPWRSWVAEQDRPLAIDLFSGAGGLSLGLEDAGYRVFVAADNDPRSIETHRANFPGLALNLDLADPDRVDDLLDLVSGIETDLLAGGPPCQPFSRAARSKIRHLVKEGRRDVEDGRRELWRVFLRVAEELRPRAVLMENVPDMALGDDCRTIRTIADRLERVGYEVDIRLIDAWRHGVPQHRQRLILVATRDGLFEWPKEEHAVTLRDAISDLPELGEGTGARQLRYRRARTDFQERAREGAEELVIHDHMTRPVRPDDREAFALMAQGVRYPELPERLRRYRADIFDDKYNRLSWDDRSRSITAHIAKDGYWYIHPGEHRTLTVREAARIQTFPDRFRFAGSRSHAFTQIGNAVPPALASAVASALLESAERPEPRRTPSDKERPSAVRRRQRQQLLDWSRAQNTPPWADTGQPWTVLVGTICGGHRSRLIDARAILATWPEPAAVDPRTTRLLTTAAAGDRAVAIIRRIAAAGRTIARHGWDDPRWEQAGKLGTAQRRWVRAVGLGEEDILANTATLRVAARLTGTAIDTDRPGSDGRIVLAQLVGAGEDAPALSAALAHLASETCTASEPLCVVCPMATSCVAGGAPA